MRKLGAVLLAVIVLAGFAYYMLILQMSSVDRTLYGIELSEVRALAGSLDGDLPLSVNTEAPVTIEFPGAAVVTGWSWSPRPLPIYAYQVVYPDGHLMIDAAMSEDQAALGGGATAFDDDSYGRLMAALSNANRIVFTHEHYDHVGGAVAHPDAAKLLERVTLTDQQLAYPENWMGVEYSKEALEGYEPLVYEGLHALAPGIVLIEAAGHTPGSQIVYVRLQSGQEFLFIGDVAWNYAGINLVRPRPNLVSHAFLGEDRARTHAQVAELKALEEANPEIAIIVGHDGPRTEDQIANGLLGNRFQ
jgi:glyoxylase-like metal-dependent hydrolase (beta-lactamase superfamily II)